MDSETETLHRMLLQMTDDIHKAFMADGIPYYVVGGTAIGCVRDNGRMVPWDDDVDIVFDACWSEAVAESLRNHLSQKYIVEMPDSKENHKGYFRVVMPNTCLIRNVHDRNDKGISVELFPMIGVPEKSVRRRIQFMMSRLHILLNMAGDYVPKPLVPVCIGFRKAVRMVIDRIGSGDDCDCVSPLNGCFFDEIVPRDVFGKPTPHEIMGIAMMFPEDLEGYLGMVYGDYMSLPPVEKRVPTYLVLDTKNGWMEHMDEARAIQKR